MGIPEATYHYHAKKLKQADSDPDRGLKEALTALFHAHEGRYGYRRLTQELRRQGQHHNHKKVQRLLKELGLRCMKFTRKSRRYNSYKGTVGTVAENRLNRRFTTSIPLQKLVTDITEFKCLGEEKLYLSPILDLYNGEVISYGIGKRPTLDLVLHPLDEAVRLIQSEASYRTTLHSDQGWHYQHAKWVRTLKENRILQSVSRKATCADNAAMENFLGVLKQEMYHGEPLLPYEELERKLRNYLAYYNQDRIKSKLAGLSPVEYRIQTSQQAVYI